MSYTEVDYPTKKALKQAVADYQAGEGEPVRIFNPGLGVAPVNGTAFIEGPQYPKPHRWYAQCQMVDGVMVSVK